MKEIKWAAIQPLTGGMYFGAEAAIGHPAKWILSFKGLTDVKYSKNGDMTSVANEYNLLRYLDEHNRSVSYYVIQSNMFSVEVGNTPTIMRDGNVETPDYEGIDLVVAVPVCSGLSMATIAGKETKDIRNSNMQWITNFVLTTIKPKVYVFENAPTLMSKRGDDLRIWFNELALKHGYSVLYYKTDTYYHDNCQKRPRTFIFFIKHNKECEIQNPPTMEFQKNTVALKDFLDRIPDGCTQQDEVKTGVQNEYVLQFVKEKLGDNWTNTISGVIMEWIEKNNELDNLIEFSKGRVIESEVAQKKTVDYFEHIKYKRSQGLNYYGDDIQYVTTHVPAVQFRSMPNMINPFAGRVYTVREYLSFMGMPYDFNLYGDASNLPKIGQNVPAGTAKFIVGQAVNIINNWNAPRATDHNVKYQNNIYQRIEKL